MKILVDKSLMSEVEADKYNVQRKSLNPSTPQNNALGDFLIMVLQQAASDIIGDAVEYCLVRVFKNVYEKYVSSHKTKFMDSKGDLYKSVPSIIFKDENTKLKLIMNKEPSELELINIVEIQKHVNSDVDLIILEKDGRLKFFSLLEYAHYKHNQQAKHK